MLEVTGVPAVVVVTLSVVVVTPDKVKSNGPVPPIEFLAIVTVGGFAVLVMPQLINSLCPEIKPVGAVSVQVPAATRVVA